MTKFFRKLQRSSLAAKFPQESSKKTNDEFTLQKLTGFLGTGDTLIRQLKGKLESSSKVQNDLNMYTVNILYIYIYIGILQKSYK